MNSFALRNLPSRPLALAVYLALAAVPSAEAGDILRGGTSAVPQTNVPTASTGTATAVAAKASANATDALARTTQAMQSVRAMQTAARKLAIAGPNNLGANPNFPGQTLPNVPNGLVIGGLQVAPGVPIKLEAPAPTENPNLWTGAKLPTQTIVGGKTKVTIVQTQSQALLNWQTFNVGKSTSITFDQKAGGNDAGKWIAFNKINDPTGNPTQILGSLDAIGQVYLINQNGILFGGSSTVNTHNLTASSLPINQSLIENGLLNQQAKYVQFQFSATTSELLTTGVDSTYRLAAVPAPGTTPTLGYTTGSTLHTLAAETDYTIGNDSSGRTVVTLTPTGLANVGTAPITANYTRATGDVSVLAGATVTSPTTPAKVGGRISLIGPNVANFGTISAPDGQIILAAGREVGLVAHPQTDASLRGLDVYVGKVDPQSGSVNNRGTIDIPRGNATLTGKNVNQLGVIQSTTSVSLNGSVDLLANYNAVANPSFDPTNILLGPAFVFTSSGTVILGNGSITRILPELDSRETVVGTELALTSRLLIQGLVIHLEAKSEILAPNASATLTAGNWNYVPSESNTTPPTADFINASGQVYLESGASLNVAGSAEISAPVSQNILTLQLRGAELADSPLQRDGSLRGTTLNLDIRNRGEYNGAAWIGTPLGDATGFAGLVQRSVGQLTTAGGSVTIKAGSSVVMQAGSTVDVSGGSLNFQGGMVGTTRVISDGRLYDISQATPDRVYEGLYTGQSIFTASKYGITEIYTNPLALDNARYENGYLQGADGGKISIIAPAMALDGNLVGQTVSNSALQRSHPPASSELTIAFQAQQNLPGYPGFSPTPPTVTFANLSTLQAAAAFTLDSSGNPAVLRADRVENVVLSPTLFTSHGFGTITVNNSDGNIMVPEGLNLKGPVAGKLTLQGANIQIASDISAPGGLLSFTAYNISPSVAATLEATTPAAATDRGLFALASSVTLNTAGLLIDERTLEGLNSPLMVNGGTISINAYSADLQEGSALDVSGGLVFSSGGRRTYGQGGTIDILAGKDPNANASSVIGGHLILGSTLRGYGGNNGGNLSVQSQNIVLGEKSDLDNSLLVTPHFFNTGGFTSFSLTGIGSKSAATGDFIAGLSVAENTIIAPVAESWLVKDEPSSLVLTPYLQPDGLRPSISVTLNAIGTTSLDGNLLARGDLVFGSGARIEVGPQAGVTIKGSTVSFLGTVIAPGGRISITGDAKYPASLGDSAATTALPTLWLAPGSLLSTRGTTVYTPDAYGRRTGTVIDGGSILVAGNIIADHGAILDVSGTTGVLDSSAAAVDVSAARTSENDSQPTVAFASGLTEPLQSLQTRGNRVDGSAGSIRFAGSQELFIDAALYGDAGGPTALNGTLEISSGRFYAPNDELPTPQDITLEVRQVGPTRPMIGQSPLGLAVQGEDGMPLVSNGHFSAASFAASGMDSLVLHGNVQFSGNVSISAHRDLSVADGGILVADGAVILRASHVTLGTPFGLPVPVASEMAPFVNTINNAAFYIPPSYGSGKLTVSADLIEIGNLALQEIGNTRLIAENGDVRGTGTFDVAGDLLIKAAQVYPTTSGHLTLVSYDKTVKLASSSQESREVVLASPILPRDFQVGSSLLGSTVQSISGTMVTLNENARATVINGEATFAPGSITFQKSGSSQAPLSAGGQLDVYASKISQNGVLRAPLGTINLGSDGDGSERRDLISGLIVPASSHIALGSSSQTSVSGEGGVFPYGISSNGSNFLDPSGVDISRADLPSKRINIAGKSVLLSRRSAVDISGGGDLYAYRFNKGNGGRVDLLGWNFKGAWNPGQLYSESSVVTYQGSFWYARSDLDAEASSQPPVVGELWQRVAQRFAVVPSLISEFAPYTSFNSTIDPGYTNNGLALGDKIWLGQSDSLSAGYYTLLPARYALLPGAVLVTPEAGTTAFDFAFSSFDGATQTLRQTGQTVGSVALPDGARLVSGYRANDLGKTRKLNPVYTRFELASNAVVRSRATYDNYLANTFLKQTGERLPEDAGHLVLRASESMVLQGNVLAQGANINSQGGLVDIASTSDILISDDASTSSPQGTLKLASSRLGTFKAGSLLIGGVREFSTDDAGATTANISVLTKNITVDNEAAPLIGADIILASRENLTLAPGAQILQKGRLPGSTDTLILGDTAISGSGDGVLLRASSDPSAKIVRVAYSAATLPELRLGSGSLLSASSLILDSTAGTSLDSSARLRAASLTLDSGKINILLGSLSGVPPSTSLELAGNILVSVKSAKALSLLSYSSVDIYGSGVFETAGILQIHAGQIRGFGSDGNPVVFKASDILLDNSANAGQLAPSGPVLGSVEFRAKTLALGANNLHIDQFQQVLLNASTSLTVSGRGGLETQDAFVITTPRVLAGKATTQSIVAGGDFLIQSSGGRPLAETPRKTIGASLTLQGATLNVTSNILLASGLLNLRATSGNLTIDGALDVGGTAQTLFDVTRYTDAGTIHLESELGSVVLLDHAQISVSAEKRGGNAGNLFVSSPHGAFEASGQILGTAKSGGSSFSLDAERVADLSTLASHLANGGFSKSQSFRLRTGDALLGGTIRTSHFALSTDMGSITVTGTIDASGATGGSIDLISGGNLSVQAGATLSVHADTFSHAGKGGDIHLEAGSAINGQVNSSALLSLQAGSTLDLSVASYVAGGALTPGSSAYQGEFAGKLSLRAPRMGDDIQIASIGSFVVGASSIIAEGYRVYDRTTTGTLDNALRTAINSDAANYINSGGAAMRAKLLAGNAEADALDPLLVLAPGVEIINRTGNLTLGTLTSTNTADWDLSNFRYSTILRNGGSSVAPGILTLRAAGDVILFNAISDGFASSAYNARLLPAATLTPVNSQSWSYHLVAGADLSAADFAQVQSPASLRGSGSIRLGKNAGLATVGGNANAQTSAALSNRFQVIRTGSGDIEVLAGGNIQLLNQFANIYTAGTQVFDPTLGGTFDVPIPRLNLADVGSLGSVQQGANVTNTGQYSYAGGNVSLFAQANILRQTRDASGNLIADSEKQLPNNWLNRRGAVNPATGLFKASRFGEIASTSWWVDFSNFFEGIGALGGGNVILTAGGSIANVDAVVPTNARMTGKSIAGNALAPTTVNLLELGGGDLHVQSGLDVDAGVYYVERGIGSIITAGEIRTNKTRSPSLGLLAPTPDYLSESSWLPTTLFLGKGSFEVAARGDVLLGPVSNPFLLPQGYNNTFFYKTYFSTFAPSNSVKVASLGGSVTLREQISLPGNNLVNAAIPLLQAYYQNVLRFSASPNTTSLFQPWLRLAETSVAPFTTAFSLMPASLSVQAFAGDINLVGGFTASPSATGNIELLSGGAINALQPSGTTMVGTSRANVWTSSTINLSDADPSSLPSITTPFAYQNLQATPASRSANQTTAGFLSFLDPLLVESGSLTGAYALNEAKRSLHGDNLLHAKDATPVRLYATAGDISGLTFFSPKQARVFASNDISDVSLYLQNVDAGDVSVVSAGRDIIASNANSLLRTAATASGNVLAGTPVSTNTIPDSEAGDLQISGPGTLEVLAGGNVDLGSSAMRIDGTGSGLTSIGNSRNLNLPFEGASLVVGAGISGPASLAQSGLHLADLERLILTPENTALYLSESTGSANLVAATFSRLPAEEKALIALDIFYRILRDAGRDHNDPEASTFGDYSAGYAAIASLIGDSAETGDILTQARDIRTKNGGDIDLLAPGGGLTLTTTNIGTTTIPPGVVTESGGSISVFTKASVDIGISRIFTLRGGDIVIWATDGDIAAGSSAKTVRSAAPTRVLIDPQSADVQTDLAGLATGGGIGVLATVANVMPGNVDLIAPSGVVDAGDAGIRATGNLNIAAVQVLNADNIQASGTTSGIPNVVAPSVNLAGLTAASNTAAASTSAASDVARNNPGQAREDDLPSIIVVEVLGYGG